MATKLDVKGDKSLWEKQNLKGVGKVLIIEESYYDGIVEMIEELEEERSYWKMKYRDSVTLNENEN